MIKVVFVGDEPSKTNLDDSIPFVGAKCFPTFVSWLKDLSIDYYLCLNSNTSEDLNKISKLAANGFKVIALGNKASKRLGNLVHYRLPHPSGLNRKLNNKRELALYFLSCNDYLLGLDY